MGEQEQGVANFAAGGYVESAPGPVPYAEHSQALLALDEARTECEKLRGALGWGPYVIVKLPQDWVQGTGPLRVTVGYGQGVTSHLVPHVLEMGLEVVGVPIGRPAEKPQELPEKWQGEDYLRRHPNG